MTTTGNSYQNGSRLPFSGKRPTKAQVKRQRNLQIKRDRESLGELSINELLAIANDGHNQGIEMMRTGLRQALRSGEALRELKRRIGHGKWTAWLRQHFAGSPENARVYMRIAKHRWYVEPKLDDPHLTVDQIRRELAKPKFDYDAFVEELQAAKERPESTIATLTPEEAAEARRAKFKKAKREAKEAIIRAIDIEFDLEELEVLSRYWNEIQVVIKKEINQLRETTRKKDT